MGRKHCGEKEKLLESSNFSFSHSVFKRLELQTRKNQGLFGKGFFFLPDDKILGLPKSKTFVYDKLNVTQNIKVVFHSIENMVGKEENAGYQHFLLFPQCFQEAFSFSALQKSSLCGKG